MTPEQIIEREFTAALARNDDGADTIEAKLFDKSETWVVLVDGLAYIMPLGSDDDQFVFETVNGDSTVFFDIPSDWPV